MKSFLYLVLLPINVAGVIVGAMWEAFAAGFYFAREWMNKS